MKNLVSSKNLFLLSLLLIVLVNGFILAGVLYNRSGEPESVVEFTEREVRMPYRRSQDQASVRINWRIVSLDDDSYNRYGSPLWFDQKKLESLGYEFPEGLDVDRQSHFIESEAILVLEYDGGAYQQAIKIAQQRVQVIEKKLTKLIGDEELLSDLKDAKENLKHEELSASRLFVIDAGLDKNKLRAKYPDNQRYILTYGIVDARSYRFDGNRERSVIAGRIDRLSVKYLHVEKEAHSLIDKLKPSSNYSSNENPPRFSLTVHYGQKLEPWIETIELL